MGKYVTVAVGLALMAFGAWGVFATWPLLWTAIKVIVPVLLLLGGLLAVLVGFGEIRDSVASRASQSQSAQTPATRKS
jgi:hypothetical protein